TLNSSGPDDLRLHCLEVSAHMLRLAGRGECWTNLTETKAYLEQQLDSGAALQKFRQMVIGQGGDVGAVDDSSLLPSATIVEPIKAERTAYITQVDAYKIAMAAFELGAGREKKTDSIDLAVGVVIHIKVGDRVEAGAPLVTIHANDAGKMPACRTLIEQALAYSDSPVDPLPLFYNTIYGD
ncbi:MAG: pyrimidine-nucleoside phosphorylase, partial [Chitinophagaceae bacterium]|nr:pyrimidine-nucleoside phosphorylase [Anaerolineae bacterium]